MVISHSYLGDCVILVCLFHLIGRAKRAPHWGVQSRFRDIYRYICMSVGLSTIVYGKPIQKNGMPKCVGGNTWSKHAYAKVIFVILKQSATWKP